MPDIKIFTPNNNIHPDGSLIFPKDIEGINNRILLDNEKIDVPKVAANNFSFPEDDYDSVDNDYDEISSSDSVKQDNEDLSFDEDKVDVRIKDTFFDSILNKIDKLISLENVIFGLIIGLSLYIRIIFFPVKTGDYTNFLFHWMKYITDNDGILAFKEKFADYTPPYLYILLAGTIANINDLVWIKSVSVFFDFVAAATIARIIWLKNPNVWKYAFISVLMMPALIINGSWQAQCDVIYASFIMLSFLGILTKKYFRSFAFFALGFIFKLQSVFFVPVFWFLTLTKNIKLRALAIITGFCVAFYGLAILPAYLVGRPLFDTYDPITNLITKDNGLLTIFFNQSRVYKGIVMGGIPNLYQWIDNSQYEYFYPAGIMICLVFVLSLGLMILKQNVKNISNDLIIKISLLTTLAVPYLLPKMHERYMFLADLISIIYGFYFPKKLWVTILLQLISLTVYIRYTITGNVPNLLDSNFAAIWIFGIIVYLFYDVVTTFRSEKKEMDILKEI
jgi:Gpi18-like mannosyltransferase